MKAPAQPLRSSAFTLVELMVSMSILIIMLAMMASIVSSVSATSAHSFGRMDNFSKARAMLNLMRIDLERGVFRQDLPRFEKGTGTRSEFSFYTMRAGIIGLGGATRDRKISYVAYQLEEKNGRIILQRRNRGDDWGVGNASVPLAWAAPAPSTEPRSPVWRADEPWRDTSEGVAGFDYAFIHRNGKMTRVFDASTSNPTVAVTVSLAVLSEPAETLANDRRKLDPLRQSLAQKAAGAAGDAWSVKGTWDAWLDSADFVDSVPRPVAAGIRTYEATVPIAYRPVVTN
jgi:type II secretory pathway component PulJ